MTKTIEQINEELTSMIDPIDPGIKTFVIALRQRGFNTSNCSDGHRGLPFPWVDIEDANAPNERNRIWAALLPYGYKFSLCPSPTPNSFRLCFHETGIHNVQDLGETLIRWFQNG